MTALAADRNTPSRDGDLLELPVAANTTIYAGALVCLDADGRLTPGATALGLVALGRAEARADNAGGAAGAIMGRVRRGVFRWANSSSADAITVAHIGRIVYTVDDQTVALTDGGGTRSPAGRVLDVGDQGVWVSHGIPDAPRAAHYLTVEVGDLTGTGVYRVVSPVAGAITRIWSVTSAALATGNATLTAAIGGTPVTNGGITITQAGSAAGDVDSATPTAANAVTAGAVISLTVGGTNSGTARATVTIEIAI